MKKELFLALVTPLPEDDLDWTEILESKSNSVFNTYLANQVSSFVNSVQTRLDDGDQCFLLIKSDDEFVPVKLISGYKLTQDCEKDLLKKLKELSYTSIIDENSNSFRVVFFTNGRNHWDYNFLKLSEHYGGTIIIFGYDSVHDDLVRQIYDDGELDTGIVAYSDEDQDYDNDYHGNEAISPYDLPRILFDSNFYK